MWDEPRKRVRQPVSDEVVATYTAAMGFLVAEWFGAILMVVSFTQLYAFILAPGGVGPRAAVIVGVALLVVGAAIYWRSRHYYYSMEFPWRRRWEFAATVFAGAGAVFWLLFAIAWALVAAGVEIL